MASKPKDKNKSKDQMDLFIMSDEQIAQKRMDHIKTVLCEAVRQEYLRSDLTQSQFSKQHKIPSSRLSRLIRNRLDDVTIDYLLTIAGKLGLDINAQLLSAIKQSPI